MSIWLIGNRGMLGTEVDAILRGSELEYRATDLEVDITDGEALDQYIIGELKAADWIVNCAAYTAVDRAEDDSEAAFRANADGVRNLAKAARQLDAALIHISTDYVFNGEKDSPYVEQDAPDPRGVYGRSKLKGEEHVRETSERHFIIRTSWLYGKHGKNFVATMLRLFDERDTVKVVSDQWGSPTFARDLAQLIFRIIAEGRNEYGIYHFANEGRTNWYVFAREIYEQGRKRGLVNNEVEIIPIPTEEYPTRAKRPRNSYLSKERVKSVFGVTIRSWEKALQEYLAEAGD